MSEVVIYSDGEIELEIAVEEDTIWLLAEEIATLFGVQRPAVVKHIGNIYKDSELVQSSTCSILEQVAKDGKKRKLNYYNLEMIISVGYRVNSVKATKFRQWATSVLKSYITNGYVINTHKITEQRLLNLEKDVGFIKSQIRNGQLEIKQGIFFDGQIYDAYAFVNNLIRSAKSSIVLFDNYIDDTVLTILSQNQSVLIKIFTKNIDKKLELDIEKYNAQYKPIILEKFELSHDRFLIIDDEIYHIGASLKDLGKKWFAFSKMANENLSILGRV